MSEQEYVCEKCGGYFPETGFNRTDAGNRTKWCSQCLHEKREEKIAKRQEKTLDGIEAAAVKAFLRAASRGGENVPHVSELLERVMALFGGSGGFATTLAKQYFDAPAGSATRTKMLESIVKLTTSVSEQGASKKPLELWSDDELEDELDKRLNQIASVRIYDAASETICLPGVDAESGGEHDEIPAGAVDRASEGDREAFRETSSASKNRPSVTQVDENGSSPRDR